MKIFSRVTNMGVDFVAGDDPGWGKLKPSEDADQKKPRRYYVYAHTTKDGQIFYIGKGTRDRAWKKDRDDFWHRYVNRYLGGEYGVVILHDNLSEQEALELEAEWMWQCDANKLVNWTNMSRKIDDEALERFHTLRDANRALMQEAQDVEQSDVKTAVAKYIEVINAAEAYESIEHETGIVGQLLAEEKVEKGLTGYMYALNRLTQCLIKLGRPEEALRHTENYLERYRADAEHHSVEKIMKRIEKAIKKREPADLETF
jgi:tetratricopeptide (TPR) repeat protein